MKQSKRAIGDIGESIAAQWLENNGFTILERNYFMPWGEIDVVCRKGRIVRFVEVKTRMYESRTELEQSVSYGTTDISERVDREKIENLKSVIKTYCSEREYRGKWCIDGIFVHSVPYETYAAVEYIDDIQGEFEASGV